jgi:hypothetical protein
MILRAGLTEVKDLFSQTGFGLNDIGIADFILKSHGIRVRRQRPSAVDFYMVRTITMNWGPTSAGPGGAAVS